MKPDYGTRTNIRVIRNWLSLICLLILVMMMLGGITRLTNSGLSMTTWQITGTFPPMNLHEWQTEFKQYMLSPEFQKVHPDFTLDQFKSIYWWEYIHRFTGRLIGIFYLIPFILLLLLRKITGNLIAPLVAGFALIVLQGILGWIMVKSGLKDLPHVNHFLLAAHLTLASATLLFLLRIILRLHHVSKPIEISSELRTTAFITFSIAFIQLILGALVAGLKAGLIYGTYPLMGDHWIAPEVFNNGVHFYDNGVALQFLHRLTAMLVLLAVLVQTIISARKHLPQEIKKASVVLPVLLCIQITLGIICLLMKVPVGIGVAHQCCGIILVCTAFFIYYRGKQHSNACYRIKKHAKSNTPAGDDHHDSPLKQPGIKSGQGYKRTYT